MSIFRYHITRTLLVLPILLGCILWQIPGIKQQIEQLRFEIWVNALDEEFSAEHTNGSLKISWDNFHQSGAMGSASLPDLLNIQRSLLGMESRVSTSDGYKAVSPQVDYFAYCTIPTTLSPFEAQTFVLQPISSGIAIGAP